MNNYLSGIIDRFENDKAVIILNDGQQLIWPKSKLTDDTTAGQAVSLYLSEDESGAENKKQLAKDVLNEILNGEE
ncbi:MAG: DUF3006 family protein [Patescibacteria group bacterium]